MLLQQATDDSAPWCTLQTSPHGELQVCKHLSVLDLECYAPEFPRGGRTHPGSIRDHRHRWIFPGYVFFRDAEDVRAWTAVRRLPGVLRVLEQDGSPALLSDLVIRQLRRRIAEGRMRPPGRRFAPGEHVVIERGPLAPLDGIFDRELDAPARVQILVRLMGRELPISIDPAHLKSLAS